eukprot:gene10688-12380_t
MLRTRASVSCARGSQASIRTCASPAISRASGARRVACAFGKGVPGSGLNAELTAAIDNYVASNKVVAFIKGTKDFPQCGFSNTVVQILNGSQVPYETVNILEEYSQWPTFPQIYIDGEFYGGCDIMIQSYQTGELKEVMERVMSE